MRLLDSIKRNLFEPEKELHGSHYIFFKIFELFVASQAIYLMWNWGLYTLKISDVILPLGLANYIDISFMHGNNLPLWNAGIFSALVTFGFFRVWGKWLYGIAFLLLHLQYVARFSIGEIPHSANLIGFSVMCFAIGLIFFEAPDKRYKFILGSIIFFAGLGYTSASFSKLAATGIDWVDGRHLWLWIGEKGTDILSRQGAWNPNFLQELALKSIPIATVILTIGLLSEFFGFLLWFRKTRMFIVTALIGMHLGITITMNIRFDAFVTELILIGYAWPFVIKKIWPEKSAYGKKLTRFV